MTSILSTPSAASSSPASFHLFSLPSSLPSVSLALRSFCQFVTLLFQRSPPRRSLVYPSPTLSLPAFRSSARAESFRFLSHLPGSLHFLAIHVYTLPILATALYLTRATLFTLPALITFLTTFLFANFIEYAAHRWLLHKKFLKTAHSALHHRFFTDLHMEFELEDDWKTILFPPEAFWFMSTRLLSGICLLLYWFSGSSMTVPGVFLATAAWYYLLYEWLHLAYHSPSHHWIAHFIPFLPLLRLHHQRHHRLDKMNKYNFNVTYPIMDWIFGTLYWPTQAQLEDEMRMYKQN